METIKTGENPFLHCSRSELAEKCSKVLRVLKGLANAPTDVLWLLEALEHRLSGGMTDEKIISAFKACEDRLRGWKPVPDWQGRLPYEPLQDIPSEGHPILLQPRPGDRALYCAVEGPKLVLEGRREKAMRWLGFVQGVTFALGLCTVEDLKNDSRPDEEGRG